MSDRPQDMTSPFVADRPFSGFALPTVRHRPGSGTAPDLAALDAVKVLGPGRTEAAAWGANQPYLYGTELFEAGFYWEAHEVWEPVWMNAIPNSAERRLLQALIQYTNAALKRDMGRDRAAQRLLAETARHLHRVPNSCRAGYLMGVDLDCWQESLVRPHVAGDAQ